MSYGVLKALCKELFLMSKYLGKELQCPNT